MFSYGPTLSSTGDVILEANVRPFEADVSLRHVSMPRFGLENNHVTPQTRLHDVTGVRPVTPILISGQIQSESEQTEAQLR